MANGPGELRQVKPVAFRNPRAPSKVKHVKVGFAWRLFLWFVLCDILMMAGSRQDHLVFPVVFFTFLAALPLFLRGLKGVGAIFVVYCGAAMAIASTIAASDPFSYDNLVGAAGFATVSKLLFYFLIAGTANKLTASANLKRGWELVDPESEATNEALRRWRIEDADNDENQSK